MDDGQVFAYIQEIYQNSRLTGVFGHIQHGTTSVPVHSAAVAYYSDRLLMRLNRLLGLSYRQRELLRGALLHDYFLYDWHDGDPARKVHGFTHPSAACRNAENDFTLTAIERDIIKKHMFPLTLSPPKYRESLVVCLVDKACSLYEVFSPAAYRHLNGRLDWRTQAFCAKGSEG